MKTWHAMIATLLVAATFPAAAQQGTPPGAEQKKEENKRDKWQIQAGWVHQWGRGMKVKGPMPSLYKGLSLTTPPKSWPKDGPENGVPDKNQWNYDDGYVFPDEQSPVDPGGVASAPRMTHYWHYENANQYDNVYHTLTFHRDQGTIDDGAPTSSGVFDDDFCNDGIEIRASRWLKTWEKADLDLDVVLGLAWFPDQRKLHSVRTTEQKTVQELDTFVYQDYYGSPAGGSWTPGLDNWFPFFGTFHTSDAPPADNPIIPLDNKMSPDINPGVIRDSIYLDAHLWRLRGEVGPTLTKQITRRLSAYVSPQFTLQYVDMCVHRLETVTDTENGHTQQVTSQYEHKDKDEFIPGFLLTGGATYLFTEQWFLGASFGWEWLKDAKINVGPDEVKFDLDGGEFSLFLGRKF